MGFGVPSWKPLKKQRINWKKKLKDERSVVINEAISSLRIKMREVPKEWHRGYSSAITTLEIMK
jgi:hypothetical protein